MTNGGITPGFATGLILVLSAMGLAVGIALRIAIDRREGKEMPLENQVENIQEELREINSRQQKVVEQLQDIRDAVKESQGHLGTLSAVYESGSSDNWRAARDGASPEMKRMVGELAACQWEVWVDTAAFPAEAMAGRSQAVPLLEEYQWREFTLAPSVAHPSTVVYLMFLNNCYRTGLSP